MIFFDVRGSQWQLVLVDRDNPKLVDRTHAWRIATTEPETRTVYICRDTLVDYRLHDVLIHEITHCYLYSYGINNDIWYYVSGADTIGVEELICNVVASYGRDILKTADYIESHI